LIACLLQFERQSSRPTFFLILRPLRCQKGGFDRVPLDSTEYLVYDLLFWLGASEGDARLSSMDDPQSSAHVTHEIASPGIILKTAVALML
jgi:hypothetical protein